MIYQVFFLDALLKPSPKLLPLLFRRATAAMIAWQLDNRGHDIYLHVLYAIREVRSLLKLRAL